MWLSLILHVGLHKELHACAVVIESSLGLGDGGEDQLAWNTTLVPSAGASGRYLAYSMVSNIQHPTNVKAEESSQSFRQLKNTHEGNTDTEQMKPVQTLCRQILKSKSANCFYERGLRNTRTQLIFLKSPFWNP